MPRPLWMLVIGQFILLTGSSFLWPLNSIYLHDHLGKSLSVAGLVLMLNAGTNVIGSLIGGFLFDKIGGYRSIIIGAFISVIALTGLSIMPIWPYYPIFLGVTGFGSGIVFPSIYAMAGSVWKEGGRKPFNAIYVAHNAGVALGSALGGLVASYSFNYAFLSNLFMYVIFLIVALFGYKNITANQAVQQGTVNREASISDMKRVYTLIILCAMFFLCWTAYVQWYSTLSAYTQEINITLKQYSVLWTINGVLVVAGQPLLKLVLHKYNDRLKGQMLVGLCIFIVAFSLASVSDGFKGFIVAMVILTVGEMLVWPTVPTVANQLAPVGREGFYQGIVSSTGTAGRMVGPVLGGVIADLYGMKFLFGVLVGLLFIALICTYLYDRPLKVERKDGAASF